MQASRVDEAIARLNEGMAAAKEAKFANYPTDWAYLALAHARKVAASSVKSLDISQIIVKLYGMAWTFGLDDMRPGPNTVGDARC
jgi:hypothetical protein